MNNINYACHESTQILSFRITASNVRYQWRHNYSCRYRYIHTSIFTNLSIYISVRITQLYTSAHFINYLLDITAQEYISTKVCYLHLCRFYQMAAYTIISAAFFLITFVFWCQISIKPLNLMFSFCILNLVLQSYDVPVVLKSICWLKRNWCQQHPVFPGGHPSKY